MISFTQLSRKLSLTNWKKWIYIRSALVALSAVRIYQFSRKLLATNRRKWIWIGLALVAVPALHIFYVQEMLAALILFTLFFVAVSIATLTIVVLVRAAKPVIAWAAPHVGRAEDRGVDAVVAIATLTIFLLVRASKHVTAWVAPRVRWVAHRGVDALQGAVASPAWARAVPHRFRREGLKNAEHGTVYLRFAALKPNHDYIAWVAPQVRRVAHRGADALKGVVASPAWARAMPHRFRREGLKNAEHGMVYLRFAVLKPMQAYRAGLRAGVAVLTIGLSVRKSVSSRLGPWLRERVALRPIVLPRSSRRLFIRMRRIASQYSNVFPRRPRKKIIRIAS